MVRRLLPLIILAIGACGDASPATTTAPTTTTTTPPGGATGTVVAVLDGDSVEADLGPAIVETRLQGINAPERGECWADEARAALEALLDGPITVSGDERDQFGRLLAYLFSSAGDVNLHMVERGAAIALSTDHARATEFVAAEDAAYAAGVGLWSPVACGPATAASVEIRDVVFDAPGPDEENPNGEFVLLANTGDDIDLTGWTIRDESSVHRFEFPAGFVLERGEVVIIRSGCGTPVPGELYWCADGSVWNNGGDMVLLLDPSGNVVDRLRYHGS